MARLVDYHIHTEFSVDAEGSPGEFARAALDAGLTEICFTDHVDFLGYDPSCGFFKPRAYLDAVARVRAELSGRLQVLAGVELGIEPEVIERAVKAARQAYFAELDYVIGSVHGVEGQLLGRGYSAGKSRREACERYLRDLDTSVRTLGTSRTVDVIGHLDVVKRYAPWRRSDRWFDDASDIFEQIVGTLVDLGIGLEVNTSGLRQAPQEQFPCVEILDMYRKRGGEILTIGSDSHSPATLAQSSKFCRTAREVIKAAGFRYFTIFAGRKPSFVPVEGPA
jgi:histidinol-phosphatase (PHP family)